VFGGELNGDLRAAVAATVAASKCGGGTHPLLGVGSPALSGDCGHSVTVLVLTLLGAPSLSSDASGSSNAGNSSACGLDVRDFQLRD